MDVKIRIMKCPAHGFMCVSINDLRITHGKCCGSWKILKEWSTTAADLASDLKRAGVELQ
jgi:hypothetical protein